MKYVLQAALVGILGLGCLGAGCSRPAAPVAATPEALVAQFKGIADAALKDVHKQADLQTATGIAQQLASQGPAAVNLLLDIMADPTANPRTKMLVTMCVQPVLMKENLARILELTDAKQEVNTRVNAAHLAASINDPELAKRAVELLQDPEPRVRLAVFNVQLMRGTPEALGMVETAWKDPATQPANRSQIVYGLPEREAGKFLPLLAEAVADTLLDPPARTRAITLLARLGDGSALPVLEKSAQSDPDPEVKKGAQMAWEALKSRLDATGGGAAAAAPASAPVEAAAPAAAPIALPAPAGTAAQ
jgi:HEAT repeat protein